MSADGNTYNQLHLIPTVSGYDPTDPFKWQYTINLCSPIPFPCDVCQNKSGYCQQSPSKQNSFCVGSSFPQDSIMGLNGGMGAMIMYTSPPDRSGTIRTAKVTANCNPNAGPLSNVMIHNPSDPTGYTAQFDSVYACSNAFCNAFGPDGSYYNQLHLIPTVTGVDPNDNFKWQYSINLCSPLSFNCDVCGNMSAYCQVSPSKQTLFCVGESSPYVTIKGLSGGMGVLASFISPPDKGGTVRSGNVTVTCNPNAVQPMNLMIHNPSDATGYYASFESAYACAAAAFTDDHHKMIYGY
jgi:hypothetical protein